MIPSSEQPAVLITATEYREGNALRHDYLLRNVGALWHVDEVSNAKNQPQAVHCSFVIGPHGYDNIRMSHTSKGLFTGMAGYVPPRNQGENNIVLKIEGLSRTRPILLCDGPNPLFNYFNAMHLLGVKPGEERVVRVQVCEAWGKMREEQYGYFFDGTTITVHKGRNRGTDILELDDRHALRRITSDEYEIVVSRYSPMFLN